MKKYHAILISLTILSYSPESYGQSKLSFASKGVWELGGSIFYSWSSPVNNRVVSDAVGLFQMQPTAGYFVYKGIEIGVQPTITITSASGSSFTQMGLYLAPSYNFAIKGILYPNVKVLIGYTSQSGTDVVSSSGFSWGVEGGVKMNLLGNSLLLVSIQYRQDTYNSAGATSRSGFNVLTFGAGWNVFF